MSNPTSKLIAREGKSRMPINTELKRMANLNSLDAQLLAAEARGMAKGDYAGLSRWTMDKEYKGDVYLDPDGDWANYYEAAHAISSQAAEINTLQNAFRVARQLLSEMNSQIERLREALEQSVKLQSHYAAILNDYEGGNRLQFINSDEWIARLATLSTSDKGEVK